MKIIFIGGLTNGKLVVNYILKQKLIELPFVITYPTNYKIQSYENFNIFKNKTKIIRDINVNKYKNKIKKANPDLIIVAGWSQLISEEIIKIPKIGIIGFHPSFLPKDRGRSVLAWQIEEGYKETALSLFYISKGIDNGDIIGQSKIKISFNDTIKDVLKKCDIATLKLMKKYLLLILKGKASRKKQDNRKATYRKLRDNSNSIIDWNKSSEFIYNKIRSISDPYPGSFFFKKYKKIIVKKAHMIKNVSLLKKTNNYKNGDIVELINSHKCIIKCSDGLINVETKNKI